jgi:TldD protein
MSDSPDARRTCTRREWTTTNALMLAGVVGGTRVGRTAGRPAAPVSRSLHPTAGPTASDCTTSDVAPSGVYEGIVQRAVEAAMAAGASYADARVTRDVQQLYTYSGGRGNYFADDVELNGLGVRVLVDGTWGFAAAPRISLENAPRLAQAAVAQAKGNSFGIGAPSTMGRAVSNRGTWTTPMRIDPFSVSIEEKMDTISAVMEYSNRYDSPVSRLLSEIHCARQERVLATSDGTLCSQRLYETGGAIGYRVTHERKQFTVFLEGLQTVGRGWEVFEDAKIWEQIIHVRERMGEEIFLGKQARPATVGRYTIVCDGATMAALADATLGVATQIDRSLGYEANASGTSFLDDPLAMLGSFQVTSPLVTFTGNRSAPGQLATVAWDDEGVVPGEAKFITDGVLTDFQTTREQAEWLSAYYAKTKRPVASHGYAAAERALKMTMQHTPNLAITPSTTAISLDRLIADVPDGILITKGMVTTDMQARNGTLVGTMRQIKNGRLGQSLMGGGILFNTLDLWKKIQTIGDASTVGSVAVSQYPFGTLYPFVELRTKGQPLQVTSRTITAPAATILNQAVVDLTRKA